MIAHVVLDRDGVLCVERPGRWLDDPADWRWERGARPGLERLARAGVPVSVATNQSGIGRGVVDEARVVALHGWLAGQLRGLGVELVGIFVCPHAPDAGCRCRKPAPGLVLDATAASGVAAAQTVVVGDAVRDLEAARAAGARSALVRTGKGADTDPAAADWVGADLDAVVAQVLAGQASAVERTRAMPASGSHDPTPGSTPSA